MRAFISYRRDDSELSSRIIYEKLIAKLGKRDVFLDRANIGAGDKFVDVIERQITSCDVVVAVIGPKWHVRFLKGGELAKQSGRRRFLPAWGWSARRKVAAGSAEFRDYVLVELQIALKHDVPIIPVLLDDVEFPGEHLPAELVQLKERNAYRLRLDAIDSQFEDFFRHIRRQKTPIIQKLKSKIGSYGNPFWSVTFKWRRAMAIVVTMGLVVGASVFLANMLDANAQLNAELSQSRSQLNAAEEERASAARKSAAGAATTTAVAAICIALGPVAWLKCGIGALAAGAVTASQTK